MQRAVPFGCVLVLLAVAPVPAGAVSRFQVTLDGGNEFVTVDNASQFSNAWVGSRVLAADRSTQDDCDFSPPDYKGLMKTGDRVFVSDYYMAWFDMTLADGITFGSPYAKTWPRSGALAGWWTLEPSNGDFKYKVTGPHGCAWAPNELVPGSASPSREQHWWDKYGPPTEHSIQVVIGNDCATGQCYFFGHHFSQAAQNGGWVLSKDGNIDGSGNVHYETSARLASIFDYQTDVTDNEDSNGVANFVESEIEYVCQPQRVLATWKLRPSSAAVVTNNLFIYVWLSYAQDQDGTTWCDAGGSGSQWPSTSWRSYLYGKSSLAGTTDYGVGSFSANQVFPMVVGTCNGPATSHSNHDAKTTPSFQDKVPHLAWMAVGESSSIGSGKPRLRWRSFGNPDAGAGTHSNPLKIDWDHLIFWNETFDGTLGFGVTRGPYTNPSRYKTFQAGTWYQGKFELRSSF